ncbi:hypothetical protein UFOVP353_25 [uncultured Caudovirales phage]|uniref:Uncharacterized protein n=1 Tax=uncultured Caudovirales phage TaxID=2100421 RepID=A0A6J5M304_9CAUD|nr:hypothetical protein UFOVP353_25 [uncultured Caudovirales phage]
MDLMNFAKLILLDAIDDLNENASEDTLTARKHIMNTVLEIERHENTIH